MGTPSIALDFNSDLTTASSGKLSVNVSSKAGNTLEIKEDGIYALADIGGGGPGYTGTYNEEGIRLGYANPYDNEKADKRVVCTNIVHHVFTGSVIDDNSLSVNDFFRPDIDCVLPGDIVRVPVEGSDNAYTYYIVTGTSNPGSETTGNYITGYARLWEGDIDE